METVQTTSIQQLPGDMDTVQITSIQASEFKYFTVDLNSVIYLCSQLYFKSRLYKLHITDMIYSPNIFSDMHD